jgi:hypothetical protein
MHTVPVPSEAIGGAWTACMKVRVLNTFQNTSLSPYRPRQVASECQVYLSSRVELEGIAAEKGPLVAPQGGAVC